MTSSALTTWPYLRGRPVRLARCATVTQPVHRRQYRQGRRQVAWAQLIDGLIGIASFGWLQSAYSARASAELVQTTLAAKRNEATA